MWVIMAETFKAQVDERGRIVIDRNTRKLLGIKKGDWVKGTIEKNKGKD